MWLRMMRRWLIGAAVVLAAPTDTLKTEFTIPMTGMASGADRDADRPMAECARDGDIAPPDKAVALRH